MEKSIIRKKNWVTLYELMKFKTKFGARVVEWKVPEKIRSVSFSWYLFYLSSNSLLKVIKPN